MNTESWESDCGVCVILVWQVARGCCGEESEWWCGLLGLGCVVACVVVACVVVTIFSSVVVLLAQLTEHFTCTLMLLC